MLTFIPNSSRFVSTLPVTMGSKSPSFSPYIDLTDETRPRPVYQNKNEQLYRAVMNGGALELRNAVVELCRDSPDAARRLYSFLFKSGSSAEIVAHPVPATVTFAPRFASLAPGYGPSVSTPSAYTPLAPIAGNKRSREVEGENKEVVKKKRKRTCGHCGYEVPPPPDYCCKAKNKERAAYVACPIFCRVANLIIEC